jgi:hypothetical protein
MQRRTFLTSSLAAATLSAVPVAEGQNASGGASAGKGRLFYELRRYQLSSGPQKKLCDDFFQGALIPAANRAGVSPVGVFNVTIGPETPVMYVLLPSVSLETLVTLEARLAQDAEYMKSGAAFLNAPAVQPAYNRIESQLMIAFEKIPGITLPVATATNGPRVWRRSDFRESGFLPSVLRRYLDRTAAAEPDIYVELRKRRGSGQVVVGVWERAGMEGDAGPPALRVREHCIEHH